LSWKDALLDLFGYTPPEEPGPRSKPSPRQRPSAAPASGPPPPAGIGASSGATASGSRTGKPRPAPPPASSPIDPAPHAPPDAGGRHGRDEGEVLRVVRAAGGSFHRVVFTRNRRVMASVADRGATLRLNVSFASAPDAVLVAVSTLFSSRERNKREKARDAVRTFIHHIPHTPSPPVSRKRRVQAADLPHLQRLRAEFDRVNAALLDGGLPAVPLYLSGKMVRRNGHFSAHPLEIVVSRRLCTHGEPGEAELTLRHEMVHLWQHATGRPVDHGLDFRRMARKLDVHPRATRPVRWKAR
jgi:hypothetical protein